MALPTYHPYSRYDQAALCDALIGRMGKHLAPCCNREVSRASFMSSRSGCLLQLLLWAQVVGVSALLLAAVHSTGMQTGIALPADHFLAVVLPCQHCQRCLVRTSSCGSSQH